MISYSHNTNMSSQKSDKIGSFNFHIKHKLNAKLRRASYVKAWVFIWEGSILTENILVDSDEPSYSISLKTREYLFASRKSSSSPLMTDTNQSCLQTLWYLPISKDGHTLPPTLPLLRLIDRIHMTRVGSQLVPGRQVQRITWKALHYISE